MDIDEIRGWCIAQCETLSDIMATHIMDGGDLNDPQYRHQLGQHHALMRMRSFIHGGLAALQGEPR